MMRLALSLFIIFNLAVWAYFNRDKETTTQPPTALSPTHPTKVIQAPKANPQPATETPGQDPDRLTLSTLPDLPQWSKVLLRSNPFITGHLNEEKRALWLANSTAYREFLEMQSLLTALRHGGPVLQAAGTPPDTVFQAIELFASYCNLGNEGLHLLSEEMDIQSVENHVLAAQEELGGKLTALLGEDLTSELIQTQRESLIHKHLQEIQSAARWQLQSLSPEQVQAVQETVIQTYRDAQVDPQFLPGYGPFPSQDYYIHYFENRNRATQEAVNRLVGTLSSTQMQVVQEQLNAATKQVRRTWQHYLTGLMEQPEP